MPESQLCVFCRGPIYESHEYVVLNKEAKKESWRYAHAFCYEENRKDSSSTATSEVHR
jgi:hypothetical protein